MKVRNTGMLKVTNSMYSARRQTHMGAKASLEVYLVNMEKEQEGLIRGIQCLLASAKSAWDIHLHK